MAGNQHALSGRMQWDWHHTRSSAAPVSGVSVTTARPKTFIRRRSLHLRQQWRQLHSHFVKVMRCGYLLLVTAQRRVLQTQARPSSPAKGEGTEDGYRSQIWTVATLSSPAIVLRRAARAQATQQLVAGLCTVQQDLELEAIELSNPAQQRTPGVKLLTSRPLKEIRSRRQFPGVRAATAANQERGAKSKRPKTVILISDKGTLKCGECTDGALSIPGG